MQIEEKNNLRKQPLSARQLLLKVLDRANDPLAASRAFDALMKPHCTYLDKLCESVCAKQQKQYGGNLKQEVLGQTMLEAYESPDLLLNAIKGLRDSKKISNCLRAALGKIAEAKLLQLTSELKRHNRKMQRWDRDTLVAVHHAAFRQQCADEASETSFLFDMEDLEALQAAMQQLRPKDKVFLDAMIDELHMSKKSDPKVLELVCEKLDISKENFRQRKARLLVRLRKILIKNNKKYEKIAQK